jgi:hypothetical protein
MRNDWPTVDLDPITQLRAVHESLPGSYLEERVFDIPFDRLWSLVDDLETFVPTIDPLVRRVKIVEREGDDMQVVTDRVHLDGELRPGFCWMQTRRGAGRFFLVGMAAVPTDGNRTRFAHMEGMTIPGARVLRRFFRRTVRWDLNGIERLVAERQSRL